MTQGKLGNAAHMAPERISILEDPNAENKPTLKTLLRLAGALDVGLDVRFVPFSEVLLHSVHSEMQGLEVDSFDDELPALEQQIAFDVAVESLGVSHIGVTRASNNLVVLPRNVQYEFGARLDSSAGTPLVASPPIGVSGKNTSMSQGTVPTANSNANAAFVA